MDFSLIILAGGKSSRMGTEKGLMPFINRPMISHILEKMNETIDKPRETLSPHAPRLLSFRIDPELIGTVIGPGGRTIKGITERTNTKIDIEDGGIVTIASHDGVAAEEAQKIIESANEAILNEKNAAVLDIKKQVASLSIEIAEKLLKEKLSDDNKQMKIVEDLIKDVKLK